MGKEIMRAHVFFAGKVQGVFFRVWVRHRAKKHGLSGWVKNLSDGRVEAVFQGDKEAIEEVIAMCRKGGPGANVTDLQISWEETDKSMKEFSVL